MRYLLILFLLFAVNANAATVFNEQFEATGYDETSSGIAGNWGEVCNATVCDDSGSIIDEDTDPSGLDGAAYFDTYSLKIVHGGNHQTYAYTYFDDMGGGDGYELDFYFRVDLEVTSGLSSDSAILFQTRDNGGTGLTATLVESSGHTVTLNIDGGAVEYTINPFSLNTRYTIELYYEVNDGTAGDWEIWVDNVSVDSGTSETTAGGLRQLRLSGSSTAPAHTVYYDNVAVSTTRLGPESSTTTTTTTTTTSTTSTTTTTSTSTTSTTTAVPGTTSTTSTSTTSTTSTSSTTTTTTVASSRVIIVQ